MSMFDAIIIGAGAAGIAAGCRLLENGVKNIIVLEANNRIGGRIHSVDVDGKTLDLGGQWCHGEENNIVYTLAKDLDVLNKSSHAYDDFIFYSPTLKANKKVLDEMLEIADHITEDYDSLLNSNHSFGDYFLKRYNTHINEKFKDDPKKLEVSNVLCNWYHNVTLCLNAAPTWFHMSAKGLAHYKACEGYYYYNWKNRGYKTILDILMRKIPDPSKTLPLEQKICFNKTVSNIQWNTVNGVIVNCSDGSLYTAKRALITSSLGVLKQVHNTLFTPKLPTYKVEAINRLGIGVVNKIFLKFPYRWWHDDPKGLSILWTNEDKLIISSKVPHRLNKEGQFWLEGILGFYPVDSHDNMLLIWSVGVCAEIVENLSNNDVMEDLMLVLHHFVGFKYNIPSPLSVLQSKWLSDPNFYGSYSYRSINSSEISCAEDLAKPISVNNKPCLLFAGEATSSHQYSTVHGAISSGFREADNIINIQKNKEIESKL